MIPTPEQMDIDFRMIISHALLGCDTTDIDKETFDLMIAECVKYVVNISKETVIFKEWK